MPLTKVGQRALELLHAYKEEHGDCLVPNDYVVGGYKLGLWVKGRRRVARVPRPQAVRFDGEAA